MKNNSFIKKITVFTMLAILSAGSFSYAEKATNSASTSPATEVSKSVEVYLPMEERDFLIYYGVTKDDDLNLKIINIREELVEKVLELKNSYEKELKALLKNEDLIPPTIIQPMKDEIKETEEVLENKKEVKEEKEIKEVKEPVETRLATPQTVAVPVTVVSEVLEYTLLDKNAILSAPILNLSAPKLTPYTESSSWFQKVKSWFKW